MVSRESANFKITYSVIRIMLLKSMHKVNIRRRRKPLLTKDFSAVSELWILAPGGRYFLPCLFVQGQTRILSPKSSYEGGAHETLEIYTQLVAARGGREVVSVNCQHDKT